MDNCGGHELNVNLNGVSIIYLPPQNTSTHQRLDLSLMTASKIRYGNALLKATIDVLQGYHISGSSFKINSKRVNWVLEEDQLPYLADAMNLFNKAWDLTFRQSVIKFRLKSEVIDGYQTNQLCLIEGNQ